MHTQTRNKIHFLETYIEEHASDWFKQYGQNLTSVQVHKKITKRQKKNYYAIAFHVVKKKRPSQLDENEIIPADFLIEFPDGKTRRVKTDVKQTGEFKFHAATLDEIRDLPTGEKGTLGVFVTNNGTDIFAVTNFHVAAAGLLDHNKLEYDAHSDTRYDVGVAGFTGRLYKGEVTSRRDVAFVSLGPATVNNVLPDGIRIGRDFLPGPFESRLRGKPVKAYLRRYRSGFVLPVLSDNAPCNTVYMQFFKLITVKRCSERGDSGGIVLAPDNSVVGIILGGNKESTFIIPYYEIFKFLPFRII
ncbi:hypothetical protein [[Flexibacter] sp. ATCC 35208]|uniref:hypothetical protein n=1 Tax=[Flexibacter] sp. ATCC 35208 TaxID=1936242 RepID=UPI0009C95137|nr:hypothetical protein [[Flexibacter] sp. ATCC 35208]OMP74705.1 hypothetical protein BW716_33925 [[Flexibacter] sp. ATCC 35208]